MLVPFSVNPRSRNTSTASSPGQLELLTRLYRQALTNTDLDELFRQAVRALQAAMAVKDVVFLERSHDEQWLRVRARAGPSTILAFAPDPGSPEASAMAGEGPVAIGDLQEEHSRFTSRGLPYALEARSALATPVCAAQRPVGALVAYTQDRWEFSAEQARLLSGVADLLSQAIDRCRAERAVRRQIEQEQYELLSAVADLTARHQQQLGLELHNSAGQELTGLGYIAQNLFRKLSLHAQPEADRAREIVETSKRAIAIIRSIAHGLVPLDMDGQTLQGALGSLTSSMQTLHPQVRCAFEADPQALAIDPRVALQLYRIAQEAVSNALRHARPSTVTVSLKREGDTVVLRVIDDGVGVDLDSKPTAGLGLRIMRHRAELVGASLGVERCPAGGTLVTCVVKPPSSPVAGDPAIPEAPQG